MAQRRIMMSACLAGVNCVYDGSNNLRPELEKMHRDGGVVLFCPEVLGGMQVPHPPSEIQGGGGSDVLEGRATVCSIGGQDVTQAFCQGAYSVLDKAKDYQPELVILKARSPSCGCGLIYDGSFSKKLISGDGVTTALLKKSALPVVSDEVYVARLEKSEERG